MFTWDDSTPTTLSDLSTNQLKISRGMRAATLCETEILAKSSPNTEICAMRGKRTDV